MTVNGNAPTIKAPGFATDDRRATRIAVDHLIALGHQRIGLAMGPMRMVPAQRKRSGYEDAMREGLPEEPLRIVETLYTYEGGISAALHLLEQGCTGIVCSSDVIALGVVHGVRPTGRSVPHDVSVIGYDDSPLIPMTDPPLTTVRQPVGSICRAAVSTLLAQLDGARPTDTALLFAPDLLVRDSTAAAFLD